MRNVIIIIFYFLQILVNQKKINYVKNPIYLIYYYYYYQKWQQQ